MLYHGRFILIVSVSKGICLSEYLCYQLCYFLIFRSYVLLSDAYSEKNTQVEHTLYYCKFILHYGTKFERRYVEDCEKWMANYIEYQEKMVKYNAAMERKKKNEQKKKEKEENERFEKIINAPVKNETKNHILRNS